MNRRVPISLKKLALLAGGCLLLIIIIGFTGSRQENRVCKDIVVRIDKKYKNHFVDDNDIYSLISGKEPSQLVKGSRFSRLDLKELEQKVLTHKFVADAELYRDVKGNLIVNIDQRRPIARILRKKAPDAYIGEQGNILPVPDDFVARVMIVRGEGVGMMLDSGYVENSQGRSYHKFLTFIDNHEFWKAQISGVHIQEKGNIVMYPQVSKQKIEFGKPKEIDSKFMRLKVFFEEVLPAKGWNEYSRVNVQYENQIICE